MPERVPYLQKQKNRAAAALAWVESRVHGPWLTPAEQFGLAEISLITATEWMRFRATHDVDQHPAIAHFVRAHAERPSVVETAPDRPLATS